MAVSTSPSVSRWSRLRAPVAGLAVAGFLGAAVVAPFAMPSSPAEADVLTPEMRVQMYQEFVPNASDEADLVLTDVSVKELPDPEEERKKKEAEEAAKQAEEAAAAADESGSAAAGAPPKYTGGGSLVEWMTAAGIAESDWDYVAYIAMNESGGNPNATNASSGACGLIQALPCSKVPGNGYDPVDNLRWASGYAVGRYGSWAAAYGFWTANHWW